jgi:hypothetical protein
VECYGGSNLGLTQVLNYSFINGVKVSSVILVGSGLYFEVQVVLILFVQVEERVFFGNFLILDGLS